MAVHVKDFGYRETDEPQTGVVQAAIDAAYLSKDMTVEFPPGGRIVMQTVTYPPGMQFEMNGCTVMTQQKGWRTYVLFETYERSGRRKYIYSQPKGKYSPKTTFRNGRFIGFAGYLPEEEFNRHQLEHSHAIVAAAKPGGGKLCVDVIDCEFSNWTGNGVYARDASVNMVRCRGENVFRGLFSGTRNVEASLTDLSSVGKWGGIDLEPEAGDGVRLFGSRLDLSHDLDIATWPNSVVHLSQFYVRGGPLNVVNRSSTITLGSGAVTLADNEAGEVRLRGTGGLTVLENIAFTGNKLVIFERDGGGHVMRVNDCTWNGEPLSDRHVERNVYKRSAKNTVTIDGVEVAADIGGA